KDQWSIVWYHDRWMSCWFSGRLLKGRPIVSARGIQLLVNGPKSVQNQRGDSVHLVDQRPLFGSLNEF
ncbi:hypothetical protein HAX54_031957, partial [Datura stramonium]|nr:hypothetical protein [Datura stramonium]